MKSIMHGRLGKCYGSATVSERGQIVIPAQARQELGLGPGTKLLIFSGMGRRGLILLPAEVVAEFVRVAMDRLSEVERMLKESEAPEAPRQEG